MIILFDFQFTYSTRLTILNKIRPHQKVLFSIITYWFNLPLQMPRRKIQYDQVVPSKNEWPIVKLAKHRAEFVQHVADESMTELLGSGKSLRELLETTLYKEKLRIRANPWLRNEGPGRQSAARSNA